MLGVLRLSGVLGLFGMLGVLGVLGVLGQSPVASCGFWFRALTLSIDSISKKNGESDQNCSSRNIPLSRSAPQMSKPRLNPQPTR